MEQRIFGPSTEKDVTLGSRADLDQYPFDVRRSTFSVQRSTFALESDGGDGRPTKVSNGHSSAHLLAPSANLSHAFPGRRDAGGEDPDEFLGFGEEILDPLWIVDERHAPDQLEPPCALPQFLEDDP